MASKEKNNFIHHTSKVVVSLIGSSGSGKGTQGTKLSKLLGIPHISLGDIIRKELRENTKIGWLMKIHDKHFFPEFIPEQIFIGLLFTRIKHNDCSKGFILDGFPRTPLQAEIINNILLREKDTHIPIFLDVPEEECKMRRINRLACPSCGYQVGEPIENPWPGYCPEDAKQGKMVELVNRWEDENKEELERRLRLIRENKSEILSILAKRDPIITINLDSRKKADEVYEYIRQEINTRLRQ